MRRYPPSVFSAWTSREADGTRRRTISAIAATLQARALDLSTNLELTAIHSSAVSSLSLDPVDGRFLLTAAGDGTLALYDVECRHEATESLRPEARAPLASIGRQHAGAHTHSASSVQWFPHDTGCFASGGYDGAVKLWDTNVLEVACDFKLPGRVHCIAMSAVATTHTLIATCADGSSSIHLCDPATGSAAHHLVGHRAPAWSLCWSPRAEHQLVSGGADRTVRVWDVRRAGSCLRSLSMHDSANERRHRHQANNGASRGAGDGRSDAHGSTTVAAAARELAASTAHGGAVTSVAFTRDGMLLITAGRDHRLRLWDGDSGANLLVHYAGTFNTARSQKQLAVSACGEGGAPNTRIYYPAAEGLLVYDLLSGDLLQTLKAHLGEVNCSAASPWEARVFSGGADCMVHAWAPPPCGLSGPAPREKPDTMRADDGHTGLLPHGNASPFDEESGNQTGGGAASQVDADAWSEDEDDRFGGSDWGHHRRGAPSTTRGAAPSAVARKRVRRRR